MIFFWIAILKKQIHTWKKNSWDTIRTSKNGSDINHHLTIHLHSIIVPVSRQWYLYDTWYTHTWVWLDLYMYWWLNKHQKTWRKLVLTNKSARLLWVFISHMRKMILSTLLHPSPTKHYQFSHWWHRILLASNYLNMQQIVSWVTTLIIEGGVFGHHILSNFETKVLQKIFVTDCFGGYFSFICEIDYMQKDPGSPDRHP